MYPKGGPGFQQRAKCDHFGDNVIHTFSSKGLGGVVFLFGSAFETLIVFELPQTPSAGVSACQAGSGVPNKNWQERGMETLRGQKGALQRVLAIPSTAKQTTLCVAES